MIKVSFFLVIGYFIAQILSIIEFKETRKSK